jgi:beta-phosphoglucomutase
MKKGIIFDLDGVIVDTAKYHYLAWKKMAAQFGYDFTEEENEAFKGVSRIRCMELLLEMAQVEASQEQINEWLFQKNQDYLAYIEQMDQEEILPGVLTALSFFKSRQIPTALGSASKNARPILEKVGLLSYFDAVVDGNDVSAAKPDPEVFLVAARQLGVTPEQCVVFEDSTAGIEAAQRAKMRTVGIGHTDSLGKADVVFAQFTDMDETFLNGLLTA